MTRWATPLVGDLLCADTRRAHRALRGSCAAYRDAVAASPDAACAIECETAKPGAFWRRLRRAAKRGDLRAAKWLCASFDFDFDVDLRASEWEDSPFELACEHGHLETARWFADRFSWSRVEYREAFWSACGCAAGPTVARWLHGRCRFERDEIVEPAVNYACTTGHPDTLSFLDEAFGLERGDFQQDDLFASILWDRRLRGSRHGGALLRWIHARFPFDRSDVLGPIDANPGWNDLDLCCREGTLETVRWTLETFEVTREDLAARRWAAFAMACTNEDPCVFEWFRERYRPTRDDLDDVEATAAFQRAYVRPETAAWLMDVLDLRPRQVHAFDSRALASAIEAERFDLAERVVRRVGPGCASHVSQSVNGLASAAALRWACANLPAFAAREPGDLLTRVARDADAVDWLAKRFGAAAFDRETIETRLRREDDLATAKRLMALPNAPPAFPDGECWLSLEFRRWLADEFRRYPDLRAFSDACVHACAEHLDLLRWMARFVLADDVRRATKLLRLCVGTADLEIVRWLVDAFGVERADILRDDGSKPSPFCEAIANCRLRVVRWLYCRFDLADARDHVAACAELAKHMSDVQWAERTRSWVRETYGLEYN